MSDFFQGFGDDDGGMRGLARDLGFRFTEELDRQYKHDNPAGMPAMPLFRHGTSTPITELVYGRFGGIDVQVFDYAHATRTPTTRATSAARACCSPSPATSRCSPPGRTPG